jgi:signal transduction histidine kinase
VNYRRWILGGLGLLYGLGSAVPGLHRAAGGPWFLVVVAAVTGAVWTLAWLRIRVLPMPVLVGVIAVGATLMNFLSTYTGLGFAYVLPWLAVFTVSLRAVVVISLLEAAGIAFTSIHGVDPGATIGITLGILFTYAFAVAIQQLLVVRQRTEAAAQARASEAVLAERQRFAREIHDVLAHSLSAQLLHLEGAALLLEQGGPPHKALALVRRASRLARDGLDETKQALHALRGDDIDLEAQIATLAGEFRAATGAACDTAVETVALAADARLTLVRTAQEALTNIRRHAPGAHCSIRLRRDGDWCELEIRDSGPPHGQTLAPQRDHAGGLSPAQPASAGYGLVGMRERAELIGGTLCAGAEPEGFRVLLRLPIAPTGAA